MALVTAGAIWVGNFIEDDTLISLRYADRFLDGKGLTWNDGERVEGYSNPSWILAAASLGWLGVDLILAVRILAFASWAITFGALLMFARRVGASWVAFGAAAVVLGSTASLSVWAMGALEQPLFVACLAVAFWALAALSFPRAHERELRPAWAALGAGALCVLVWTRPDGPLLVAVFAISSFFIVERSAGAGPARFVFALFAGGPFLAWMVQLGFRLAYYGEWLPNPALIKTHLTLARMREGLDYLVVGLAVSWLLTGAGIIGAALALFRRSTRPLASAVLSLVVAWGVYVVVIGGDHFPAFRHLLVIHLCLAILLTLGLSRLRDEQLPWIPWAALILAGVLTVPYVRSQRRVEDINVARRARWQWDGQALGQTFARAFASERPLWAVTAAGCLPYFSGLPALDLLGLNDAHIARQPPDPSLQLAHDHGDGAYVLERAPDLITFGLPRGGRPIFKSGREMAADARFGEAYQRVTFRTLAPVTMVSQTYVNRRGRVGFGGSLVDGSPSELRAVLSVPAYMFRGVTGHPLPDGSLGARLEQGRRVSIDLPELPPGAYRVRLDPPNALIGTRIVASSGSSVHPIDEEAQGFAVTQQARLRLELRPLRLITFLRGVVLERLGDAAVGQADGRRTLTVQTSGAWGDLHGETGQPIESWTSRGDAFEPGPTDARARGRLTSAPFTVPKDAWLEFRIAGGKAEGYDSQVGVRLVDLSTETPEPRMVFTGRGDDELREVRVDLSLLTGRLVRLEVFDESPRTSIAARGFVLHAP